MQTSQETFGKLAGWEICPTRENPLKVKLCPIPLETRQLMTFPWSRSRIFPGPYQILGTRWGVVTVWDWWMVSLNNIGDKGPWKMLPCCLVTIFAYLLEEVLLRHSEVLSSSSSKGWKGFRWHWGWRPKSLSWATSSCPVCSLPFSDCSPAAC